MLLKRRPKTTTNPVFYADRLRNLFADDPDRVARIFEDPRSVDLLTWNVFETMDSDRERDYLAGVLRPLAGNDLRAPLRVTLWTGRSREPKLHPSPAYVAQLRERVADEDADLAAFLAPVEAPVRIEGPGLVALVDATLDATPRGAGGRDRIVELVDAGLEQARNLGKILVVGFVYRSGTQAAHDLSVRINRLREPERLAAALPWRDTLPRVRFREMPWQQLVNVWERERNHFQLSGQPVRDFLEHARRLGLR